MYFALIRSAKKPVQAQILVLLKTEKVSLVYVICFIQWDLKVEHIKRGLGAETVVENKRERERKKAVN